MVNKTGLISVDAATAAQTILDCQRDGYRVFRLPADIDSKEAFFEAVRRTLPLDPELHSNHVWDALSDSLWSGLYDLSEEKILIVWPNSAAMHTHAPEDFGVASDILMGLTQSLADRKVTAGGTKQVLILQLI